MTGRRSSKDSACGRLERFSLDPKMDVVFKMLFAAEKNRGLLISLLTVVLRPADPIATVEVLNPEIDRKEWDDKGTILDIRARFADGRWVDVEMQARRHGGLRRRVLYYWARLYAGQLKGGEKYTELVPVVGVFVLGFDELPADRLHSVFEVREREEGYSLSAGLELHFLELSKLERVDREREDAEVVYWCQFFAAETDEELERLAMDHPEIRPAKEALDELSSDPKARRLAEDRVLWHWMYDDGIATARKEGREEGRQEGREEGRQEGRGQERRRLVRHLLEKKFGALDEAACGRFEAADDDTVEQYAERMLTADTLAAVFAD